MSFLSNLKDKFVHFFHGAEDKLPVIIADATTAIQNFGLTPEHIQRVRDEVVAVEKTFGGSVNGFVKAGHVADALGALTGDLALPASTSGFIGVIIANEHAIITAEQLIASIAAK